MKPRPRRREAGARARRAGLAAIIVGALAATGVALAPTASADPTIRLVGDPTTCPGATYSTIQDAVAAADPNDTIQVCAGSYGGQIDDGGKALTFRGPQAGVDPRPGLPRPGGEAVISGAHDDYGISLGGGSSVDGFWFNNNSNPDFGAVVITGDTTSVMNSVFANSAVAIKADGSSNLELSRNVIDTDILGVRFASGTETNSRVTDNLFTGGLVGVAISANGVPGMSTGLDIARNTVAGTVTGAFVSVTSVSDVTIEDNRVDATNATSEPIDLRGGVDTFTVRRNVVSGSDKAAVQVLASHGSGSNTNGTISQNLLLDNRRGIDVGGASEEVNGALDVHNNVITVRTNGTASSPNAAIREIDNGEPPTPINATNNFYGCNTGPGTAGCGAILAGAVTSSPYLVLRSSIGTKTLGPGGSTAFSVNLNSNSAGEAVLTPILDGLPATFAASSGLSLVAPTTRTLVNGVASIAVKPKPDGLWRTGQSVTGKVVNATSSQSPITVLPAKPAASVADTSTTEGTSGSHVVNFTVKLSHSYNANVTLKYATANGSAKAPGDYLTESGLLTFAPGQVSKTVGVTVKGDKVKEANEVFFLNLTAPTNATIADPNGSCIIRNS